MFQINKKKNFLLNLLQFILISILFLANLLAGTLAYPLYQNDYKALSIIFYVFYFISLISIFVFIFWVARFRPLFIKENNYFRFFLFCFILAITFILFTAIMIIFSNFESLKMFKTFSGTSILFALISSLNLGVAFFFSKGLWNENFIY